MHGVKFISDNAGRIAFDLLAGANGNRSMAPRARAQCRYRQGVWLLVPRSPDYSY